jgi:hypothetical protein
LINIVLLMRKGGYYAWGNGDHAGVILAAVKGVEELKRALGGLDAKTLTFVDCRLCPGPPVLLRRPTGRFGVLEVACGAGRGDCFRFLVGFCELMPGPEAMRQALASEDNELVRDVWNRLSRAERADGLVSFAGVAADFHNQVALGWLLGFADVGQFGEIATAILLSRRASPLITLMNCGFSVARCSVAGARALVERGSLMTGRTPSWEAVLTVVQPARQDAWMAAFGIVAKRAAEEVKSGGANREEPVRKALLRCAPVPVVMLRFAERLPTLSSWDRKELKAAIVGHVLTRGGSGLGWRQLLEQAGISAVDSVSSARALIATGVSESEFGIPDELSIAAYLHPDRFEALCSSAMIDTRTSMALHWAAAGNNVDAVKILLKVGIHPERFGDGPWMDGLCANSWMCTPLHAAARTNAVEAARVLCDAGANVNQFGFEKHDIEPSSALHVAAQAGWPEMTSFLIGKGIDLNAKAGPECGFSALYNAIWECNFGCAKLLIEAGARFNMQGVQDLSLAPFHEVCQRVAGAPPERKAEVVALAELMIARGLKPIAMPIFRAIDSGEPRLVEALVRAGANLRCAGRETPLEYARKGGNEAIVRILAASST